MIVLIFCLLFGVPLLFGSPIVTILIVEDSDARAFGSGFVSSPNGDVITCYHVIEGASKIQVFYNNRPYAAEVLAISVKRDVAKLRMTGVASPTEYLPVRFDLPEKLTSQQLMVRGFAFGQFDQKIFARATQDTFALTDALRDAQYDKLFNVQGVKIIPLDLTIFKGMSGAPLITPQGEVIGIISGSLTQGGSFGWAIAIENIRPTYLTSVVAPRPGFAWPRLELMAGGWNNLRRQSAVGGDLAVQIEEFLKSIDAAEERGKRTCTEIGQIELTISNMLEMFDAHPEILGATMADLRSKPEGQDFANQLDKRGDEILSAVKRWGAIRDSYDDSLEETVSKLRRLSVAINKFMDGLPSTPKNVQLRSDFNQQLARNTKTFGAFADQYNTLERTRDQGTVNMSTVSGKRANWVSVRSDVKASREEYCNLFPDVLASAEDTVRLLMELLRADTVSSDT